jgi:hypothetical protein
MSTKRKIDGNISLEDLKNDPYVPVLTNNDILKQMALIKKEERRIGLAEKLVKLTIDYDFESEFGGVVNDRKLNELSNMYVSNIKQIKDHILWEQCGAIVTDINMGYTTVDDL